MTTATESKLIAFHGKQEVKDKYVMRVRAHRAADNLIRGTGWDKTQGKGCAVGCTLEGYNHASYETELGIPQWVARMEDYLFENLSHEEAMAWPERFLQAIPVGKSNWNEVYHDYFAWLMDDPTDGVIRFAGEFEDVKKCIERVAMLHRERCTDIEKWDQAVESAVESAWSAVESAYEIERICNHIYEDSRHSSQRKLKRR